MTLDLDTLQMLRDSVARYAAEQYGFQQRRAWLDHPARHSEAAWRDYAAFGWLALRLPEAAGGLDADAAAVGALMETVGQHLLMEPLLATAVLGAGLVLHAADAEQQARWLPALADGQLKLAFASDDDAAGPPCTLQGDRLYGRKVNVLHGDIADHWLVAARDADGAPVLVRVAADAPQVQCRRYPLVDGRGAALLDFDGAPAERLAGGDAGDAIARARDEAAVALCAEALGVVRSLVATTCAYLKVRSQFGRPIGQYQALQHRMVDLFLLQEDIQALTRAAEAALSGPPEERARIVSGAKAYIGAAARHVANEAVQLHGGVGITEELDVSHHFRRVMVINALFGSRDEHLARFTEASLAGL